jgi:hypothetical protein
MKWVVGCGDCPPREIHVRSKKCQGHLPGKTRECKIAMRLGARRAVPRCIYPRSRAWKRGADRVYIEAEGGVYVGSCKHRSQLITTSFPSCGNPRQVLDSGWGQHKRLQVHNKCRMLFLDLHARLGCEVGCARRRQGCDREDQAAVYPEAGRGHLSRSPKPEEIEWTRTSTCGGGRLAEQTRVGAGAEADKNETW